MSLIKSNFFVLGDCDSAEGVREGDPGGDEGEPHDGVGDVEGEADDGDHPDHHVGQRAHPHDRQEERRQRELGQLRLAAVCEAMERELL